MRRPRRWILAAAAGTAAAALVTIAAVPATQAAWTDEVYVSAVATAGDWSTKWTGSITEGNDDTVIENIDWTINNTQSVCADVTVTGATETPELWQLDVDLQAAPWYGVDAGQVWTQNANKGEAIDGVLPIYGTSAAGNPFQPQWNNTPITSNDQAVVQICTGGAGIPTPADPMYYSVAQEDGPFSLNQGGAHMCTTLTVTGLLTDLEKFPFYYGWQTTIDFTGILDEMAFRGFVPTHVDWGPPPGEHSFTTDSLVYNPPQESYVLTSGRGMAIQGTQSQEINACIYGSRGLADPATELPTDPGPIPTPPEVTPEVEPEPVPETDPEVEPDIAPEPDVDSETDVEPEPDVDGETGSGSATEEDLEAESVPAEITTADGADLRVARRET